MSSQESMEFQVRLGKSFRKYSSDQTWFFLLSPTGYEKPLKDAPIERLQWRQEGSVFEQHYKALKAFKGRLVYIHTSFGKPTKAVRITLSLSPKAEKIEIKTPNGFFIGRAKITEVEGKSNQIKIRVVAPPQGDEPTKKFNLIK